MSPQISLRDLLSGTHRFRFRPRNTSTQEPLILYDIPLTKPNVCWSPNVWRIRLALNYKGIPYKTEWIEYPDIGKVGKEIGAKPTTPNPDGSGALLWTCPMLKDPNHLDSEGKPTIISDSPVIVKYLDKMYPERKVIPDGTEALQYAWGQFISQNVTSKLFMLLVPLCSDLLNARAKEYFISTREKWWGPLSGFCPDRTKGLKELQDGLNKVAAALDENGEGADSVMPGHVLYADFAVLGPLLWAHFIFKEEERKEVFSWNNGRWARLLEKYAELLRVN